MGTGRDWEQTGPKPSLIVVAIQFVTVMMVLNTWQYFMHRLLHHKKFLYKHIHYYHHRLVVPYAFRALYNHPLEGLLIETIGGALSFLLSEMSPQVSIFFFSFGTIKLVDDHYRLWLHDNPFHIFFTNNLAYHDVHHQLYGTKYNFSQPFFVMWDKILGTHMPCSLKKRTDGGFETRPLKEVTGRDKEQIGPKPSLIVVAIQFVAAMVVLDTWQYFMHKLLHHNKFLYKHIHSHHHRLVVPHTFGALYNHPLEGLLIDTIGGALSFLLSGMSRRVSIFFFSFATIKSVDDNCGL
ncbi:hypothetical protein FNV43_RR06484 [Rhamnella rubrinervis]|uniref:Fatty acid hydroxylase domain-containing protein n=1 Tax=Rhamnella rubrinervis TaxID=2594499 RepID=A0A8K0HEP2_9ROSA|nr:hypothetical protein FNV43_RR06484 [Rhamnella rubrinervis]